MTIHWWNTDKLVERLVTDSLSESESLRYAMVAAALYTQAMYWATWFGGYQSWLLLYEFAAVTAVALIGVSECFKANDGSLGSDFLKRLAVLGVPVGIKVMLASIVLGQVLYFGFPYVVTPTTFRDPVFVYQLASFVFGMAFMAAFYWRIAFHLRRIVRMKRSNLAFKRDALKRAP